jgi:hypothetical protein
MRNTRSISALALSAALCAFVSSRPVQAQDSGSGNLRATPFAFVGTEDQCGGPAGSRIVTAAWLGGMGLPDNGGQNTTATDVATNPNKKDPHRGLLLSKNGPTPDCSSAGVTISGMGRGFTVTELGFDYRNGTHCGAGAPRFNITSSAGFTYFAGCGAGLKTAAPQDPLEWTRVRFTLPDQVFPASSTAPPFVFGPGGTEVRSLAIVYDEGTDTSSVEDSRGVGLSVLDNIDVNGRLIRSGNGIADGTNTDDDRDGDHDHDGDRDDDDHDR